MQDEMQARFPYESSEEAEEGETTNAMNIE